MSQPMSVVAVGECMVELRELGDDRLELGFGGDTFNAAAYLKRASTTTGQPLRVAYLTGVGDDAYSQRMRALWRQEDIEDCAVVQPGSSPGLYIIRVDAAGERRFHYWRDSSAAAQLFSSADWVPMLQSELVLLSGVSLQIMSGPVRNILLAHLHKLRGSGTRVAFDTNYRPTGWESATQARSAIERFAAAADFVFATFGDEQLLFGDGEPRDTARRYADLGCAEVVVKLGEAGVLVGVGGDLEPVPSIPVPDVQDTTAAGDAFAGTYLAWRLAGATPHAAAGRGVRVAAAVVSLPGALPGAAELASVSDLLAGVST